jgi:DNA-binding GntR family transcriptional regulator
MLSTQTDEMMRAMSNIGAATPLRMRKADFLYEALKRRILLAHLGPASAVGEKQVADEFGCSQGTVREALLRLEQDGLVTRRGYRGTVVSGLSLAEVAEMVMIRIRIECAGVRQCVGRIGPDELSALAAIIDSMAVATEDNDAYLCSELDRAFHVELLRASGMHSLEPILRRCSLHMHRFTVRDVSDFFVQNDICEPHRDILRVVSDTDPQAAEALLRAHTIAVVEHWSPQLLNHLVLDEHDPSAAQGPDEAPDCARPPAP